MRPKRSFLHKLTETRTQQLLPLGFLGHRTHPSRPMKSKHFHWRPSGHCRSMMAFLGWSLILTGTLQGQLIINEFLASNRRGLIDEDRQRVDWIEIANTSTQPVSTEGWSLTDDPEKPKKMDLALQGLEGWRASCHFCFWKEPTAPRRPLAHQFQIGRPG